MQQSPFTRPVDTQLPTAHEITPFERLKIWLDRPANPFFATQDYDKPPPAYPSFDYNAVRKSQQDEHRKSLGLPPMGKP